MVNLVNNILTCNIKLLTNQSFDLLILISYLKRQGNNSSYYGFLNLHYRVMVTSTFSDNWKSLDNAWSTHFLEEAERLNLYQKFLKERKNYCINNFGSRSRKLLLNLREYSLGTPALVVTDQELFGLI
ncbi:hypothetical protein GLOIN_2v1800431 [Rhizophagus irregularis DAOM 181602=DAOM 197198]|nr:hypothetical protein GLOIN_2v1800431 [Rhizophagus irregularis DAOM 181602=DAOM 197198]